MAHVMSRTMPLIASLVALIICGCGPKHPPVAPVKGQIFYQGKPLQFGSVMLQPTAGPPARGVIQPDGTFELSTYGDKDGAIIGQHVVRIVCVESQRGLNGGPATKPAEAEFGDGKPLIPSKYSYFDSSDLKVEVKETNEPIVWKLTD